MGKRHIGPLAALMAASAVGTILFLRLRPEPPPPVVPRPTAQRVAQAARHLEALTQETLTQGEGPPKAGPRTLRLTEDDINVYLAGSPVARRLLGSHGITAVQVILTPPDGLTLHATVTAQGQPRTVQIDGVIRPDPIQGLSFTATHAQAGRFPLPPSVVTAQAQTVIGGFVRRAHGHLPIQVQSAQIDGKTLLIVGLPVTATPESASPAHH